MARVKAPASNVEQRKMRPALTPEARENQMISLAMDCVEERLMNRTASSQETTHFLKLATVKYKAELEKMKLENELTKAKTKAIEDAADMKELYSEAIKAMRRYSGQGSMDDEDDYEDL